MHSNSLARTLGFLGGLIVLVGSVFNFFYGVIAAAIDRSLPQGFGSTASSIVQAVVAILLLFFVALAGSRPSEYRLAGGVVLVVVSLVGLVFLGGGFLILIGLILTLVAGVLFVVPAR